MKRVTIFSYSRYFYTMLKTVLILFLIFETNYITAQILTPKQQQEDFEQLNKLLLEKNLGLNLYFGKEDFEQRKQEYRKKISTERSELEYFRLLKKYILPIQENHLSIRGFGKKSKIVKEIKSGKRKFLPLYISVLNDSTAHIVSNLSQDSTIQVPSKLISINEKSFSELRDSIHQYLMQDKDAPGFKDFYLERNFETHYHLLVDSTSTFRVKWLDTRSTIQEAEIQGVSRQKYTDSLIKQAKKRLDVDEFLPNFKTSYYPNIKTGYLDINTFSKKNDTYNGKLIQFHQIVKRFFKTINEQQFETVIIDLRNNTGGRVNRVKFLLSFLIPKKQLLYTKKYKATLSKKIKLEKSYSTKEKKDAFHGKIYVLTNGGSYSASVMTTMFLKQFSDATIVGQTAGGRFNGTTAGSFTIKHLNHSNIVIRIPESVFYYANPKKITSLKPDIEQKKSVSDYFNYSKDNVLEQLLLHIQLMQEK